jgi:cardiolipin synthase
LAAAIDASYREVRLETYIFHVEGAVVPVVEALAAAARRGVAVHIVMDGAGTSPLPPRWVELFAAAGVQWHRFLPLQGLGIMVPGRWRRLHRPQSVARLDYAVCVSGPMVAQAQRMMAGFWARLHASYQMEEGQFRAAGATLLGSRGARLPAHIDVSPWGRGEVLDDTHASLVLRDNVRNRARIEKAYRQAIHQARWEVLIASAYFLPGRSLRLALLQAAQRGVNVRLVLQGRYEYFLQYHATRAVYSELLAAGVEIVEYHAGFLHAKVAVVDGLWSTVGSSNLDPLSLLLAREANVVVEDARFATLLRGRLLASVEGRIRPLDSQAFAGRPLRQRFFDALAYALVRVSLFLLGRRY